MPELNPELNDVANYELKLKLSSSLLFNIYRGRHREDKKNVIIKIPKKNHPPVEEINALEHEYLILKKKLPGVVQAQDFIHWKECPILVIKDYKGISLKNYLAKNTLSLHQFFDLAIQLTDIIINLHKNKIIHKDISPANILIDPKNLKLQLLDLSLSTQLEEEMQDYFILEKFEGSPAYMSPEQTGRTNRPVYYRTDFYSLGITFFEMLTGRLPFQNEEMLELVHCHLAKKPPLVHEVNPKIPEMLSQIVDKLLAKLPEERYASAVGIKEDLLKCVAEWTTKKTIIPFNLATKDIYDHLQISHKIYGREDEIDELIKTVEKIKEGHAQVLFIKGYSGIGKTSLVKEIHKPTLRENGYFIQGKFDQLKRGTPYSAFVSAFQELVKQLLSEPDEKLNPLKEKLKSDLHNMEQVITKLIPGFKEIIGTQTEVNVVSTAEAKNQFVVAIDQFIRAFSSTNRFLIIFLDDLQWADNASLKLIEYLFNHNQTSRLLLIGAYRENEVDINHPLTITQGKLKDKGILTKSISLEPLKIESVTQLIADTLNRTIADVESLSKIIAEKTGSNPFFINEFLKSIYHENLLYFDYQTHEWCWQSKKILEHSATENIIDLLTKKLHRLSAQAFKILCFSACIGYKFDLKNLQIISNKNPAELKKFLWEAIQLNFIRPLHHFNAVDMFEKDEKIYNVYNNIEYEFIHDRIQQAVYQTLSPNEKKQAHLAIAQTLLAEKELEINDDRLFVIADHLTKCLNLLIDAKEGENYAQYFYWAGLKAKESIAFDTALNYLNAGISLLKKSNFTNNELNFKLCKTYAECSYTMGNLQDALQVLDDLLKSNITNLQKSEVYSLKSLIHTVENKHELCIEDCIEGLKGLDVRIPKKPTVFHILWQVIKVAILLRGRNIVNDIDKLPRAEDPKQKARIYIMVQIVASAYSVDTYMVAYCIAKAVYLSFKYGLTPYTNLIGYGILLIFELRLVKAGFRIFEAQQKLVKIWDNTLVDAKYFCARGLLFDHWFFPLSVGLESARLGYQYSIAIGDTAFAGYSKYASMYSIRTKGSSLRELYAEIEAGFAALKYIHDQEYFYIINLEKVIYDKLTNAETSTELLEKNYNRCIQKSSSIVKRFCQVIYGELQFLIGNKDEAFEIMQEADKLQKFARPFIWNQDFWAIYTMLILDQYPTLTLFQKMKFRTKLFFMKLALKKWTKICLPNIEHKYLLVQAELKRFAKEFISAGNLYDAAIYSAEKNNFIKYVAIINERAAQLYLELNKPHFAKYYILAAEDAYKRFGAKYKCQLLQKTYPQFFESTEVHAESLSSLDLAALLKAYQVISKEISLDKILQNVMQVVLQAAGAERSILLKKENTKWRIEAIAEGNHLEIYNRSLYIADQSDLPFILLNRAQRTKSEIVLHDVFQSVEVEQDEYLRRVKPKSILVLPIVYQNEVQRILYLENRTGSSAFTPHQIESLKLLASQVAIALENAVFYEMSDRFVPHAFLERLNKKSLTDVHLGDQTKTSLSVLFCDIRNFTSLSEMLTPEETLQFINEFWNLMEPIITAHGGFIDKYIGDSIMALFNDPSDQAVKAALEMIEKLQLYNRERELAGKQKINIGIGINTGNVILGVVGTSKRMDSSVMGDVVNIASRIEELTKEYKTPLIISEATRAKLDSPELFDIVLLGRIVIRGKAKLTKIWQVKSKDKVDLH